MQRRSGLQWHSTVSVGFTAEFSDGCMIVNRVLCTNRYATHDSNQCVRMPLQPYFLTESARTQAVHTHDCCQHAGPYALLRLLHMHIPSPPSHYSILSAYCSKIDGRYVSDRAYRASQYREARPAASPSAPTAARGAPKTPSPQRRRSQLARPRLLEAVDKP